MEESLYERITFEKEESDRRFKQALTEKETYI
jgi:hypothetical protein